MDLIKLLWVKAQSEVYMRTYIRPHLKMFVSCLAGIQNEGQPAIGCDFKNK